MNAAGSVHGYYDATVVLSPYEARMVGALYERMFPADEHGPGALEIGAVTYLDRALAGPYRHLVDDYKLGLAALDAEARRRHGCRLADCSDHDLDSLIEALQAGTLTRFHVPPQRTFFATLLAHLHEGLFADPAHGGNRDKAGWRFLRHPGVWLENSAEENLAGQLVDKQGTIRSMADAGYGPRSDAEPSAEVPNYDPQHSVEPPRERADVIIVGMGAVGGFVAPMLADAGLKVAAFEAGPWRHKQDYHPDELSAAYYCRGDMGVKYLAEAPRWRRNSGDPTGPMTFSLGRMMNGVGGSVVHWGGALRRLHPHHFRYASHVAERWGSDVLPDGHTLVDWPIGYDELEPYYCRVEHIAGVAGDESNPFVQRSRPLPMPPLRPFRKAELFRSAAERLGLHPHPTPVCVNSVPYNGFPATKYHSWSAGFGSFDDDRWNPGMTSVPEALATGNLDLRTHCRVLRVLTDRDGRASGVEYLDPLGRVHVQEADTVIVATYTFENVRLLLLSADSKHVEGLGNNNGQLGKHFMFKQWGDVYGHFPDVVFNAHTGPAAQMWTVDDYDSVTFDSFAHGFVGGASLNVENQQLPIQIARDPVPDGVPEWGQGYKDHLREWPHIAAVRIQPDSLSYATDYIDLDPVHRERSAAGLPVLRVTADMRPNEERQQIWMEEACGRLLREMGATRVWRGQRFKGVASSHDLGGTRMGVDPSGSVVDVDLQVHDTPGLYVFGGSVLPTMVGVNPQLTIWALAYRATERLIERLKAGEQ
jgi:gluconate 2-dehydrogenase alpha chain